MADELLRIRREARLLGEDAGDDDPGLAAVCELIAALAGALGMQIARSPRGRQGEMEGN